MITKIKKQFLDKWPGWKKRGSFWMIRKGAKGLDRKGFNRLFKEMFAIWMIPPKNRWGIAEWQDSILLNKKAEVMHPCRVGSCVEDFIRVSEKRRREMQELPLKRGDRVATKFGKDRLETYGTVKHSSVYYIRIEWDPKYGDWIDPGDVEKVYDYENHCYTNTRRHRIGWHTTNKCYSEPRKEKGSYKKTIYGKGDDWWKSSEVDIETEFSAVGPDNKKIVFRKIEVPKEVNDWAQRSKIDARFF